MIKHPTDAHLLSREIISAEAVVGKDHHPEHYRNSRRPSHGQDSTDLAIKSS